MAYIKVSRADGITHVTHCMSLSKRDRSGGKPQSQLER